MGQHDRICPSCDCPLEWQQLDGVHPAAIKIEGFHIPVRIGLAVSAPGEVLNVTDDVLLGVSPDDLLGHDGDLLGIFAERPRADLGIARVGVYVQAGPIEHVQPDGFDFLCRYRRGEVGVLWRAVGAQAHGARH